MMKKPLLGAAICAAVIVAVVAPLGASAAEKQVIQNESFDFEVVIPDLCEEGDVTLSERGKARETLFFDNDGNLSKGTFHIHATTVLTGDGGELFDRWAWAGTYDPETDSFRERGNQFNVHSGAGGVLVNDSGLIEFRFGENGFELIRVAGPRDSFPDGPGDPCGILFP